MSWKKLLLWRIAFPSLHTVSIRHHFLKAHKRNTFVCKTLNAVAHQAKKYLWKPMIRACGNSDIISGCHISTELSSIPALCLLTKMLEQTILLFSIFHPWPSEVVAKNEASTREKRNPMHSSGGWRKHVVELLNHRLFRGIRLWKRRTVWTRDTGHFRHYVESIAWLMGFVFGCYCWK